MSKNIELIKLRQVLMRIHNGISDRQISKDLSISRKTVAKYSRIIRGYKEGTSSLIALDDTALATELKLANNGSEQASANGRQLTLLQQLEYYKTELSRPGVTLQLLWEEYRKSEVTAFTYSYASFCRLVRGEMAPEAKSFHKEYAPGEVLMIDFAGDKLHYVDRTTGEQIWCPVFVAVLGYSNYTYAEVLPNCRLPYLIAALNRALRYIQGVPLFVLTDNMAQLVSHPDRYEPTFNNVALSWANHNGTMLQAARVAHPKDKAGVERHVRIIYHRIYAPLRDCSFNSFDELAEAVGKKLDEHNHKNFQGRSYSRNDQFMLEELPRLKPLPTDEFKMKKYAEAKVQKNYHVFLGEDKHFYSVPCRLVGQRVQISYTTEIVEIYHEMVRVAIHKRGTGAYSYTTVEEHMPKSHQEYARCRGYRGDDFLEMAARIGPHAQQYLQLMLKSRVHQEHAYIGCLGIIRMGQQKEYGPERLEKACAIGLELMKFSYKTILTILSTGADQRDENSDETPSSTHENLRGPNAFNL
jgi:transposase